MSKAINTTASILILCFIAGCATREEEPAPTSQPSPITRQGREMEEWISDIPRGRDRPRAVAVLGEIGRPAVPGLRKHLRNPATPTRVAACEAILLMPPGSGIEAVPELQEMLASPDDRVVVAACRVLQLQGSAAEPAALALVPLLDRESWQVRYHAARTLGTIDHPDAATRKRLETLSHKDLDRRVRQMAASAADGIPVELSEPSSDR